MAPQDGRRDGPKSGKDDFEGRDLLVGRPEGAKGRPTAGAAGTPQATTSPQPSTHDDAIREILETVRATAARVDALQDAPGPEHETAEALARETAALTQAVEDARAALAKAAELAARRNGAEAAARVLAEGVAALKAQGEALDKRLRATGTQVEANARQAKETGWQAEVAAQGMAEMKQAATALNSSLRVHTENMSRMTERLRWRPWLTGLAIGAASFVFFALGAVLQRETDVVSFGDPRHEWNEFVAEHYAPTLAVCASKARQHDQAIRCRLQVDPSRELTVPLYPDVALTEVPPEEDFDTTTDR